MSILDISKLREQVELDLIHEADPTIRRRLTAYMLRAVKNRSLHEIARELGVSVGTAHADVQWGFKNYPPAYESAETFRRATLVQFDEMISYLSSPRQITKRTEAGDFYEETEYPDRDDFLVIARLRDQMAKLLGAYAPREVSGDITVRTALELPEGSTL